MPVPDKWSGYSCEEYFRDGWSTHGHFDAESEVWVIVPLLDAYEDNQIEFFAIGRSGWGGIDFGYRKGHSGLWAFYPIGREFKFMASTITELIDGWCSSQLHV